MRGILLPIIIIIIIICFANIIEGEHGHLLFVKFICLSPPPVQTTIYSAFNKQVFHLKVIFFFFPNTSN